MELQESRESTRQKTGRDHKEKALHTLCELCGSVMLRFRKVSLAAARFPSALHKHPGSSMRGLTGTHFAQRALLSAQAHQWRSLCAIQPKLRSFVACYSEVPWALRLSANPQSRSMKPMQNLPLSSRVSQTSSPQTPTTLSMGAGFGTAMLHPVAGRDIGTDAITRPLVAFTGESMKLPSENVNASIDDASSHANAGIHGNGTEVFQATVRGLKDSCSYLSHNTQGFALALSFSGACWSRSNSNTMSSPSRRCLLSPATITWSPPGTKVTTCPGGISNAESIRIDATPLESIHVS